MPFWKKMLNQKQAVYYPRAIVQGQTRGNGDHCQGPGKNLHSE